MADSPLRKALAAKRVRETTYLLAVADDTAARAALEQARSRRNLAGIGKQDTEPEVAAAQEQLEKAQAELDACYYPLRLRGIPAADLEALVSAHPPGPKDREGASWNQQSLAPALLAAVVVDSDLSEAEWSAELSSDRWTRGDVDKLFVAAMGVCIHAVNDGVGKG